MKLTQEQIDWFDHIDRLMGDNEQHDYDLSDDRQYALAKFLADFQTRHLGTTGHVTQLELARRAHCSGQSPIALADCIANADTAQGWANLILIPGLGLDDANQKLTADGFGTVVGGFTVMNFQLIVKDNSTNTIVASGANNAFSAETLGVQTQPIGSGSTSQDVTAYLSYSFQTPVNTDTNALAGTPGGMVKRSINGNTTGDPHVTSPTRTTSAPLNPHAINIGLARNWPDQGGSSQFDYAFAEPPQSQPIGKMPFQGSVTFQYPIADITPNTGLLLRIYIADASGGGGTPLPASNLAHVYTKFSIDPNDNKTLRWDLPPGVNTHDPGDPITFGNITWPSNMEAFFYCGMFVQLTGTPEPGIASIQSKINPNQNLLDGNKEIMPIEFIWHCLGEGTKILMADGSLQSIENIITGDQVMGGDGHQHEVLWTTKGAHIGDLIEVRLADGKSLTCTDQHVIETRLGYVPAEELSTDDVIHGIEGTHTIAEINVVTPANRMLYNLGISEWSTSSAGTAEVASFVANGMFVGDVNGQKAARAQRRQNPDWLKSRVPDYYHDDIDRHFETSVQLPEE